LSVAPTEKQNHVKEMIMAKILIVDDDPDVVDGCRLVLEKEGFSVVEAASGKEGLKIIETEYPDLIILDVMMEEPDDGISMAQKLRKDGFTKPILMLSSIGRLSEMKYDKDDDRLPVDEFVNKPVKPSDLVAKIKKLLKA
jgi:CheY-like chemotaxis protein